MNCFRLYRFVSGVKTLRSFTICNYSSQSPSRKATKLQEIADLKMAAKRIVWIDMEMTGLDVQKDSILEVACLVTDKDLSMVATGPNIVIHQSDEVLAAMDPWCIRQHGETGLTEASRTSTISLHEAEDQLLAFLKANTPKKKCALAGNTVWMDRLFLKMYMPRIDDYLHYRIIDVSTVKELAKRWYQKEFSDMPTKRFSHRALDDITDSITELKYYKDKLFK